jgi:O-antigen/teichoic acid export membrane protein
MAKSAVQRLSLRQNFAWTFAGSVVVSACKWAMFVLLTKLAAPSVVGDFSLALAVATPITILAQLQLRVSLITDVRDDHPYGAYYAMRLVTTAIAMVAVFGVAAAAYGVGSTAALILVVAAGQGVTSLRDIWLALSQKYERMDIMSIGNVIDAVLSLAFFGGLLLATDDILVASAGIIVGRAVTLIAYDIPRVKGVIPSDVKTAPEWHMSEMVRLFWVVLPLGITTTLVSLNSNVPRYFIEHWLGKDALGYFAAIAYFIIIGRLFISALGRSASPRLAVLYRENRPKYGALVVKLVMIGAVIGTCGVAAAWLLGEPFLRIVYTEDYAAHSHIMVLLMIAGGIFWMGAFLGTAISSARFFKVQTATYILVVAATACACYLLIPRYGLDGAAYAVIVGAASTATINAAVVVYVYRSELD